MLCVLVSLLVCVCGKGGSRVRNIGVCSFSKEDVLPRKASFCGRTGYTGPTGRTGPCPDPSDPTAYCTYTSLAQLLASSSLLVEVILASSLVL